MEKIIGQFIMNNKGNFSLTETFTTESPYWEIRNDRILYIISDRRIDTGEETYRKEISVCMSEEEARKNECGCYYRILKSSEKELNERRNKIMTIREAMEGMHISNEYDYRIGFINADGQEDETELSADSNEDLVNTYEEFCADNEFSKDTVIYIDLVRRTHMEMNVGYLKDFIKDLPDDMSVFVACRGECNYDFDYNRPCEDTDTFGIVHDGKLFITDDCAVDIGNGETL